MPDTTKANCVIIDDDPAIRRILARHVFEVLGVQPEGFSSPADADEYAPQNPDVSVILIDWHIGEVDGLKWIEPLSRHWPQAVFIVISADSDPHGYLQASRSCRLALWWRKTDSLSMLGSLITVAMEEHLRRLSGESNRTLAEIKDTAIRGAVAGHSGNLDMAAKELGVSTSTIRRHLANGGNGGHDDDHE